MRLKLGREYLTLSGLKVRIICVDRKTNESVKAFSKSTFVGLVEDPTHGDESVDFWDENGNHSLDGRLSLIDAEKVLLHSLKLDDPIEVLTHFGNWIPAHFAGTGIQGVRVWANGMTSKTVPEILLRKCSNRGTVEYAEFRAYKARR
jgi:hypothetical protein